ncbi:hypothetical protein M9H77_08604 [Catharanthus roseus]|uniref:Uncharacterized protein n=1 Tax=Catharanthus roseus TaxID=4058 RepID=A0ACC0BYJ1_CATRO|nr:hypothetical protein M9H77_08604 [Catharanthus roseus]
MKGSQIICSTKDTLEEVWIKLCSKKKSAQHVLIAQIYVDDIVFGSTLKELTEEFITSMRTKFKMIMFFFSDTYSLSLHIPTLTIVSEQPTRPRKSLALGHEDCTFSPLARTRYSFLGSSSTVASFATVFTPVIRPVTSLSLGHYLVSSKEFSLICRLRLSETNMLRLDLMKMPYKALSRVFCGNWLLITNVTVVFKERAHLICVFATRKTINICAVIFRNILKALDPLVMPKIVALIVVLHSPTPCTQGHTGPSRSTRQELSRKKQPNTEMTSPSPPAPSVESSEATTSLDLLNQQLSTVVAFVLQIQ